MFLFNEYLELDGYDKLIACLPFGLDMWRRFEPGPDILLNKVSRSIRRFFCVRFMIDMIILDDF